MEPSLFSFINIGLGGLILFMVAGWLYSVQVKDASIVDRLWGMNFILLAVLYSRQISSLNWRQSLVLVMLSLWGGRLSLHIHLRNRGHPEDYRYQAMRRHHGTSFWWKSLFTVFLLQGVLAFIINAPVLCIFAGSASGFGIVDLLAVFVWGIGFYFEVVGDLQLNRFKADPKNKGKLLNTGLWALTRHPNYFGDAVIWWGYFLLALPLPYGWLTFIGPLLMSLFLRYVSGVSLLEKSLSKTKPGFQAYVDKTPAFIPRFSAIVLLLTTSKTD